MLKQTTGYTANEAETITTSVSPLTSIFTTGPNEGALTLSEPTHKTEVRLLFRQTENHPCHVCCHWDSLVSHHVATSLFSSALILMFIWLPVTPKITGDVFRFEPACSDHLPPKTAAAILSERKWSASPFELTENTKGLFINQMHSVERPAETFSGAEKLRFNLGCSQVWQEPDFKL